ncbi:hypothetical protein PG984_008450 [Apiospora sp. TS-2023a]
MASSRSANDAAIEAVDKAIEKPLHPYKRMRLHMGVTQLTDRGADDMYDTFYDVLRSGTLQVGLHVELDLVYDSISARKAPTQAALMRGMGYVPEAEKPEAKQYLASALAHLQGMSDPLPAQLRKAVGVNLDANSTPADAYRDAVTVLMSSISTFHAYTTLATSIAYNYLKHPVTDARKPTSDLLKNLLDPIDKTFGLRMIFDRVMASLGNPESPSGPREKDVIRELTRFLAGDKESEGDSPPGAPSPRRTTVEVMLRLTQDMARINFLTRVVGHSLMIALGRFDPNDPDSAVQWQGTDIESIAKSYKNFELLQHRMVGHLTRQTDSTVTYRIDDDEWLESPVFQKLLQPTIDALKQQPGLQDFELEHVVDHDNEHFHDQFSHTD